MTASSSPPCKEGLGVGDAAKASGDLVQDELRCPVGIVLDFVVPQPDDRPALTFKEGGSTRVIFAGVGMLAAIKLDRQFRLPASNVDDEGLDNQLTSEPRAVMTFANWLTTMRPWPSETEM